VVDCGEKAENVSRAAEGRTKETKAEGPDFKPLAGAL
jgi:hypothetical protein